jgi:hypothetical protein
MSNKTQVTKDRTSCEPEFAREIDAVAFKIVVSGVVTGITSPTMTFCKEGSETDLSSTYLTGSMSVSGVNTIITKTTTGLKAGRYVVGINGTVDGQVQNVATIPFIVKRKSEI